MSIYERHYYFNTPDAGVALANNLFYSDNFIYNFNMISYLLSSQAIKILYPYLKLYIIFNRISVYF